MLLRKQVSSIFIVNKGKFAWGKIFEFLLDKCKRNGIFTIVKERATKGGQNGKRIFKPNRGS